VSEEIATQIAKNCSRKPPHSHLRPTPTGTTASIRIYSVPYISRNYTVSQKRDPDIIHCNFQKDWRILTIFCKNIPNAAGHQMALQVPTSPNICFYTTWGKQNKRNMHGNEQQTSRNWRLDSIKFWSQRSELMKYIVYLLTAVLPAIKRVTGDTFVFQQ